jgi:DNA invertase Pin-like site-specific DNA recombinase
VVDDWMHEGVTLHLIDLGGQSLNTSTAMGKFFLTMAAAFAELERNMTSERTSDVLQYKIAQGGIVGRAPLGSRWEGEKKKMKLVENPEELAVIQRIVELHADHLSLKAIADVLNETGVPGRRRKGAAGRWHPTSVARVLARIAQQRREENGA